MQDIKLLKNIHLIFFTLFVQHNVVLCQMESKGPSFVRGKIAFHVDSVVVDDGRWSVDHFRRSVEKYILSLVITSF